MIKAGQKAYATQYGASLTTTFLGTVRATWQCKSNCLEKTNPFDRVRVPQDYGKARPLFPSPYAGREKNAKASRRSMLPVPDNRRPVDHEHVGNRRGRGRSARGSRLRLKGLQKKTDVANRNPRRRPLNQHTLILASLTSEG